MGYRFFMTIKITTIITSLNTENFISRAIESFLAQNYDNKELIIVDGKSTDSTHQIIKSYLNNNPGIIKMVTQEGTGLSNARNIGIKVASGDIIGFLGADDLLDKDIFEKMANYSQLTENYDVIYFNSYIISKNEITFNNSASRNFTKKNLLKFPPIAPGEAFYYKKHIFNDFQFNENNLCTSDYEFNMALVSSRKHVFFPINETGVYWINYGNNISSKYYKEQRYETIAVMLKYCSKFSDYKKVILYNLKNLIKFNKNVLEAYRRIMK